MMIVVAAREIDPANGVGGIPFVGKLYGGVAFGTFRDEMRPIECLGGGVEQDDVE